MLSPIKGACQKQAPFFVVAGFIILCMASFPLRAQVPVVDIEDRETVTPVQAGVNNNSGPVVDNTRSVPVSSTPQSRQGQLADVFVQLQQLQREVQELRGLVEQQNYEIQTLKQQRKDDYIDIDRRLGALQSSGVAAPSNNSGAASSDVDVQAPQGTGAEKDSYDAAYLLLDQNRKDEAITAFRKHISRFPDGEYSGNAYYWLGLIYFTQNQLDQAQEQFSILLKKYPDHRKTADAKFALGKVYFQQGKKAEAKKLIQEVAQGDSKAAAPAKAFLQANF